MTVGATQPWRKANDFNKMNKTVINFLHREPIVISAITVRLPDAQILISRRCHETAKEQAAVELILQCHQSIIRLPETRNNCP